MSNAVPSHISTKPSLKHHSTNISEPPSTRSRSQFISTSHKPSATLTNHSSTQTPPHPSSVSISKPLSTKSHGLSISTSHKPSGTLSTQTPPQPSSVSTSEPLSTRSRSLSISTNTHSCHRSMSLPPPKCKSSHNSIDTRLSHSTSQCIGTGNHISVAFSNGTALGAHSSIPLQGHNQEKTLSTADIRIRFSDDFELPYKNRTGFDFKAVQRKSSSLAECLNYVGSSTSRVPLSANIPHSAPPLFTMAAHITPMDCNPNEYAPNFSNLVCFPLD